MKARLQPSDLAVHGGRSRLRIDLSASLNPLGPSRPALEAARSAELSRYPDPEAAPLATAAAVRHGIPGEAIVPVPGASWGLWFTVIAHAGAGLQCVAVGPCFGEYRRFGEIAGCTYQEPGPGWKKRLAVIPTSSQTAGLAIGSTLKNASYRFGRSASGLPG